MYTRLNDTITNAIKNVMNNSVCDFDNWWKDDFETEYTLKQQKILKIYVIRI